MLHFIFNKNNCLMFTEGKKNFECKDSVIQVNLMVFDN